MAGTDGEELRIAGESSHHMLLLQREVLALRQELRTHKEELHEIVRKELTGFRELLIEEVRELFSQEGGWPQRVAPRETLVPAAPSSPGTQCTQGSSYGIQVEQVDPRATPTQLLDSERDTQSSQKAGADDTPSTCGACGHSDPQDPHSCRTRPRGIKLSSALPGPETGRSVQRVSAADTRVTGQACQAVPHRSQPSVIEAAEIGSLNGGNREEEDATSGPLSSAGVAPGLDESHHSHPADGSGRQAFDAASDAREFSQGFAAHLNPCRSMGHNSKSLEQSQPGAEQAATGFQSKGILDEPAKVQRASQQREQDPGRQASLQWYTKKAKTPKGKPLQSRTGKQGKAQRGAGGHGKAVIPHSAKTRRQRVPKRAGLQFEEEYKEEDNLMQAVDLHHAAAAGRRDGPCQPQQAGNRPAPEPEPGSDCVLLRDDTGLRREGSAERTTGEEETGGPAVGFRRSHAPDLQQGSAANLMGLPESPTAEKEGSNPSERAAELPEGSTRSQADVPHDVTCRDAGTEGGQVKEAKWRTTKRKRVKEATKGAVIHVLDEEDDFLSTPRDKACFMRMQREHSQGEHERLGAQGWSFGDDEQAPGMNGRVNGPDPIARLSQGLGFSGELAGAQNEALLDSDETTRGSSFDPGQRLGTAKGAALQQTGPRTTRDCESESRQRIGTAMGSSYQHEEHPLDPGKLAADCKENLPVMALHGRYVEERQGRLGPVLDGSGGAGDACAGTAAKNSEMRRPLTHGTGPGPRSTELGDTTGRGAGVGTGERQAMGRDSQPRPGQEEWERGARGAQGYSLSRPLPPQGNSDAGSLTRGPAYKYNEVVRRKADREALAAGDCVECRKFYDAVMAGDPHGLMAPCCQQHQEASRHRYRFAPPSTPQGFWNIGFDSDGS